VAESIQRGERRSTRDRGAHPHAEETRCTVDAAGELALLWWKIDEAAEVAGQCHGVRNARWRLGGVATDVLVVYFVHLRP
jgi:hypothetical protein